jgi:hypothetical protein
LLNSFAKRWALLLSPQRQQQFQTIVARFLIRFKRLTHVSYSSSELNELIKAHIPQTFIINTPAGQGKFTLLEAELTMPSTEHCFNVQLLSSFEVQNLGNPIYRAHLIVQLHATPQYEARRNLIYVNQTMVRDIRLIHDEYALLTDTQQLLNSFLPGSMASLLSNTVKSTLSLFTAGTSDAAMDYLKLYVGGSKQRVLDYHKPQLEKVITELAASDELQYKLDETDWEESLFAELGKEVVVEEGELRFKF